MIVVVVAPPGIHEYVVAPEAVNVTALPLHTELLEAATDTVGAGLTFCVTVVVAVPQEEVPVMVYTVVAAGVATTEPPLAELKVAAGAQV